MSVAHSRVLDQFSRTSCRSLCAPGATFSNRQTNKTIKAKRKKEKKRKKPKNKRWTPLFVTYTSCVQQTRIKKRKKTSKKKKTEKFEKKKKLLKAKANSIVSLRNVQTSKVSLDRSVESFSSCIIILSFSFTLSLFLFLANASREDQERTRRLVWTHSLSIHTQRTAHTHEYMRIVRDTQRDTHR